LLAAAFRQRPRIPLDQLARLLRHVVAAGEEDLVLVCVDFAAQRVLEPLDVVGDALLEAGDVLGVA
jgi:hypothetical protein